MSRTPIQARILKFATYEVDRDSGELYKSGVRQKLTGQPFEVLCLLLERPNQIVTREEFRERLWSKDTFVDYDLALRKAITRLRESLGDSAENPRFIETIPRKGYRFLGTMESGGQVAAGKMSSAVLEQVPHSGNPIHDQLDHFGTDTAARQSFEPIISRKLLYRFAAFAAILLLISLISLWFRHQRPARQRALTRLTFDAGLQTGATWSPDGRFIAYSSNRGGKFDIWVQSVSGGDAVEITHEPGQNWQPEWSPDGKYIAYRSENRAGGLFIVPALKGARRKLADFGYYPRWSP